MKQKNRMPNFENKQLRPEQLLAISGGEAATGSTTEESSDAAAFSSISNVLKTKHDTAKNSVGNVR